MTDTPRTDAAAGDGTTVPADFAADLERELNAAKAEVEGLRDVLTAIVDFVDGPAEEKRPDVFALRMNAARNALKEPK
jgi:hypothetical protein